jgi:hypothetical protein
MPGAAPRPMKTAETAPTPPERRAWEPDPLFSGQGERHGGAGAGEGSDDGERASVPRLVTLYANVDEKQVHSGRF